MLSHWRSLRTKFLKMKLCQGQTWKRGDTYFRIAKLDRLSVDYKLIENLTTKEGGHHRATKKEFCRLIKNAVLMTAREVSEIRDGVKVIDLPTSDSKEAQTKPI